MALNSTIAMLLLSSMASRIANETEPYPQMVNHTFIIELVSSIHRSYPLNNFVFYISERLTKDTDTAAEFFHQFWDAFPTVPTIIIIDNTQPMKGFLSTPSMCLVLTTEHDDPIMEVAALSLKGVRFFKTIFIVFPIVETDNFYNSFEEYNKFYENIRLIYQWVWVKQFLNTILVTIHNNVYIHDPYPTVNIVNMTDIWTDRNLFPRHGTDFKGYVVNTPIRHDLPRVFYMTRRPQSWWPLTEYVSGVSGKIFTAFISAINATFNESLTDNLETEPVDINNIMRMVEEKQLEISLHSYTDMFASNVGTSYPIGINDWCLMVPFRNRSPEHVYLQESFQEYTWLLICFSAVYITLGIWLCSPSRKRDLSLSFIQSICSIILIVPLRVLTVPTGRIRFIFVLLFVMGFFITNMYVSKMASFLAASTAQPQINTVQDVISANLPVMLMIYEYDTLKEKNYPQNFLNLVQVVSKDVMDKHRDRFNTSYGYSVQTDRWQFLNKQQLYLKKPLFRLTDTCIGPFYHVFPLQKDSHLDKPMQTFIMTASQAGLLDYWENEAFADALFLGYVRMMLVNELPLPLTVRFFQAIWFVWWFGLVASGLAFCLEVKGVTWQNTKVLCGNCFQRLRDKIYEI